VGGVEGIVNGMDTNDWSPENDKFIMVRYSPATVDIAKRANKAHLQAELGLPVRPPLCKTVHMPSILAQASPLPVFGLSKYTASSL
jgi:glycogen synthase